MRARNINLLLAILSFVAMSMDTATKVLHGVVHRHEAHAQLADHRAAPHESVAHAAHWAEEGQSSVDAPDSHGHHYELHHAAAATLLLKVPPAVGVMKLTVPTTLVSIGAAPYSRLIARAHWPSSRAGPDQPRAPPLG